MMYKISKGMAPNYLTQLFNICDNHNPNPNPIPGTMHFKRISRNIEEPGAYLAVKHGNPGLYNPYTNPNPNAISSSPKLLRVFL